MGKPCRSSLQSIEQKTSSSAGSTRPPTKLQKFVDSLPPLHEVASTHSAAPTAAVQPLAKPKPPEQRRDRFLFSPGPAAPSTTTSSTRPTSDRTVVHRRHCSQIYGNLRPMWCNACRLGGPCTKRF